jgi:hypothetical protein
MTLMEQRAAELRRQLRIPGPGEATNAPDTPGRPFHDGWWVEESGARWIGLVRGIDRDSVTGQLSRGVLLAEQVLDRVHEAPGSTSTHYSSSFVAMTAAGHYAEDPALVLAIGSREAGGLLFSQSVAETNSYSRGGADNLWRQRNRISLPPDVRRRLRRAPRTTNERGRPAEPALVQGRDQMIVYAALVLRAAHLLEVQIANVFGTGRVRASSVDVQMRLLDASRNARRAWTQLSFGRGGGGGLVRALERAEELGGSLETIFTDDTMLESDSVKRARVTAGDAALIEEFVLPHLARPSGSPDSVAHRGPA